MTMIQTILTVLVKFTLYSTEKQLYLVIKSWEKVKERILNSLVLSHINMFYFWLHEKFLLKLKRHF